MITMDRLQKMLSIPLDFPTLVMERAEIIAESNKKYIGYLEEAENDIVLRVFACRRHKGKDMEITEVMRRITQEKRFVYKNLYGGGMSGYQAVYKYKDEIRYSHGYPITVFDKEDFDVWFIQDGNGFGIRYNLVNADMLKDTQFKYCGYSTTVCDDVIGYLNQYIKHPSVEYFGKLGIKPTPTLIRKAEKDKAFRNWLLKTKIDCFCGPNAIIYAYEHNIGVPEAKLILKDISYLRRYVNEIKETSLDYGRIVKYIRSNSIPFGSYNDYLKALKKLKYDLTDTKNTFPRDFKRMHDMRIAEYDSVMAKEDMKKRKALYEKFEKAAQEAKRFEFQDGIYAAIIPSQIQELVREGRELHHCVGKMGYDKKMADGDVVIVFIRSLADITKPLATVEYGLKSKRIHQSHVDYNGAPEGALKTFIDEWEKRTTEALRSKKGA